MYYEPEKKRRKKRKTNETKQFGPSMVSFNFLSTHVGQVESNLLVFFKIILSSYGYIGIVRMCSFPKWRKIERGKEKEEKKISIFFNMRRILYGMQKNKFFVKK